MSKKKAIIIREEKKKEKGKFTFLKKKKDGKGYAVSYTKPSLTIEGALIIVEEEGQQQQLHSLKDADYLGGVIIKLSSLAITTYAGLKIGDVISFFLLAHVHKDSQPSPTFSVDGFSLGFGINREFKFPGVEDLAKCALIPSNEKSEKGGDKLQKDDDEKKKRKKELNELFEQLDDLKKYLAPSDGTYWVAGGIDFTVYSSIRCSSLLVVRWGTEGFCIGLLGNVNFTIPLIVTPAKVSTAIIREDKKVPKIINIDINFLIAYDSSSGKAELLASLTPKSFVLDKGSKATGQLALVTWFSGEHKGDFIMTLGGYYPGWVIPKQYPQITKPVSFSWKKLDTLEIQGTAYFAFLARVFMLGLGTKATMDLKVAKVWFGFNLDLLINIKPFNYKAALTLAVGASIKVKVKRIKISITISVHISAKAEIWGPEFGGHAVLDLDVIKITVPFGEGNKDKRPTLTFADAKDLIKQVKVGKLKPEDKGEKALALGDNASEQMDLVDIKINKGVDSVVKGDDGFPYIYRINPFDFEVVTSSTVPGNVANILDTSIDKKTKFYDTYNVDVATATGENPAFLSNNGKTDEFLDVEVGLSVVGKDGGPADSRHTVVITNRKTGDAQTELIVQFNLENFAGYYIPQQQSSEQPNSDSSKLLENGLQGAIISPKLFFPARTQAIKLYFLIFTVGNKVATGGASMKFADAVDAKPVASIDELSFYGAKADIDRLQTMEKASPLADYFNQLSMPDSTPITLPLWSKPLACELAEEVNQFA